MILNTDKQKTSLKGVYVFYSVIITLCILALFVFNLSQGGALHVGIALRIGHAQSQTCGADASRHRH